MQPHPAQLAALVAVVERGTFEAAARSLHITPSAVSQRIRALESEAGQVLVRRTSPCSATPAGEVLLRLARQTALTYAEANAALGQDQAGPVMVPVVLSADSLATWFRDAMSEIAAWEDVALRLSVEDQAHSVDLLRRGEVLAAVTSEPAAVQGCSVIPLGSLRYAAVASPEFVARWWEGSPRRTAWASMPMIIYSDKDYLQDAHLTRHLGVQGQRPPMVHQVPTSADFHEAVVRGLGWGMIPEPQLEPDLADGRLVRLGREWRSVPLYWQRWRLESATLDRLDDVVQRAALRALRR